MNKIPFFELQNKLKAGDILLTKNPDGLGTVIKWFQELEGDEAIYTHAALVSDEPSVIYEANAMLDESDLKDYLNTRICVIRHEKMTDRRYKFGFKCSIQPYLDKKYPYHRLVLHAFDNGFNWLFRQFGIKWKMKTAKWFPITAPVCSEWVDMFFCDVKLLKTWRGHNPDHIHDRALKDPKKWKIIAEGVLVK